MRPELEKKMREKFTTPIKEKVGTLTGSFVASLAARLNIPSSDTTPKTEEEMEAERAEAHKSWLRYEKRELFIAAIQPDLKSYRREPTSWLGGFDDDSTIAPVFSKSLVKKWKWYSSLSAINRDKGYIKTHLATDENRISGTSIRLSKFKAFHVDYDLETESYITRTLNGGYQTYSTTGAEGYNGESRHKKTLIPHSLYKKNPDAWILDTETRHATLESAVEHFNDCFAQEILRERLRAPWRLIKITGAFAIAGSLLVSHIEDSKVSNNNNSNKPEHSQLEP